LKHTEKKTTKNRQRNNKPHETLKHEMFGASNSKNLKTIHHEKSRTKHQQQKNNPPNVPKIHTIPKPQLSIKNKFLKTISKENHFKTPPLIILA
ncbi:MAG: hypothetical protein KMY52_06935, partial [Methanobacterium sp.]|nr:hypothetical protein [Methanobacterium sp.]